MGLERGVTLSHYRLVDRIGEGGMGVVWKAVDTMLGREIALKVLPEAFVADPRRQARFEREAKTLAALNHPNIVTIHSIEESGDTRFLTMELVTGRPLSRVIPRDGLKTQNILDIAIPLASALAAAHDKGIIHRDLKPANIMVSASGAVKVLDFGLAKLLEQEAAPADADKTTSLKTATGELIGTLPYMSPEQLEGRPADARSDIFSLGAILYEMATGDRPFRAERSTELVAAILRDTPPPVSARRPDLPADLDRIVRRSLEKDPSRRYQTALDVRNELEDLQKALSSVKEPVAATEPASRRRHLSRPQIALGAAGALACLVLAAVLVVGPWARRESGAGSAAPPQIRSLAVLPLENLTGDPHQEYLVEGIHDALITELARVGSLKVISRTSVAGYKKTDKPLPGIVQIARELGVDALVEGSVLRVGDAVKINAQLIDGRNEGHLWAQAYDRDLRNVMSMVGEVTRAIAAQIKAALTPQQQARLSGRRRPVNPEAQDLYLRGRQQMNTFTPEGIRLAIDLYQKAIAIDPAYAPAYAGLGVCYTVPVVLGWAPARSVAPTARAVSEKAVELDEGLGEAHTALGLVKLFLDWDWAGGGQEFKRALELNSTDFIASRGLSDYFVVTGDFQQALDVAMRAHQVDPLSPVAEISAASRLTYAGRRDETVAYIRDFLARYPAYANMRTLLARALWGNGRYDDAVAEYRATWREDREPLKALDQGMARGGPQGAMRAMGQFSAAEARKLAARGEYADPVNVAGFYAMGGDANEAFSWLERAYAVRAAYLIFIKVDERFAALRPDPRLADLARRIGLP